MVKVKRKQGESISALIYRFSRRVHTSGVILDVKKRRYNKRKANKNKRKVSTLHRIEKKKEHDRKKKMGLL